MNIKYIQLSNYIKQRTKFSRLVYDSYKLIDFIGEDYEHLSEWYWTKAVPWVFYGNMEFFIALDNNKVIGLLIAKKENSERKICTLCVNSLYYNMGIASTLIQLSFKFLQTTKPIITFPEMLDNEDSSKAIPGVNKYKALGMYQSIYPEDKEALGVYVFELRKQVNEIKLYTLSSQLKNHKAFVKLANAAYNITDFICKDYPKHFAWYWSKQIPRVFDGTGEVVVCTINGNVVGISFLKKDDEERKICTFFVDEKYRGKHIATKMLETSFKFLGTQKPLITIADYKIPMYKYIIKKYNWNLTQIMEKGYYNNSSQEFVFNGKLPK